MADILQINHIKKSFGSKQVLKDVTFKVPEHTVYGFVGKNGAGKTTTMKATLGLLSLDGGEIIVDDKKVVYGSNLTNKIVGYLPDVPEFYSFMTPMEYLRFCGELSGMEDKLIKSRSLELLDKVGLAGEKHRIKGFSRGMKQRLGVAQALIHRPRLLICDEPTSALDPVGRKELMDILTSVKDETTVIFSTHILSDVERICDEIAFLHEGNVVLSGNMNDIKKTHKSNDIEVCFDNEKAALLFAQIFKGASINENKVNLYNLSEDEKYQALQIISDNRLSYERISHAEWSLEKMFLEVAGR